MINTNNLLAKLNTNTNSAPNYIYLGDRNTVDLFKGKTGKAVRKNKKCIRGKNGSMLVQFEDGKTQVIIGRLLRKIKPHD